MNENRALIIGYGSIGERHARLLEGMGCDIAVVSSQNLEQVLCFPNIKQAINLFSPNYVVIANQTNIHFDSFLQLINQDYDGKLLIEKPVFERRFKIPSNKFSKAGVAYNLRFHPVLTELKHKLTGQRICSINAYVGQYLPSWRPNRDYRNSYSASAEQGGGAILDLSHDLDYICWLTGSWQKVAAIGGRFSDLEIDSDDVFSLLFNTERCPAISIELNYLDRKGRRRMVVNTESHTYEADLVNNILTIDDEQINFSLDRDSTYKEMHKALLYNNANINELCTMSESLSIIDLVNCARASTKENNWKHR